MLLENTNKRIIWVKPRSNSKWDQKSSCPALPLMTLSYRSYTALILLWCRSHTALTPLSCSSHAAFTLLLCRSLNPWISYIRAIYILCLSSSLPILLLVLVIWVICHSITHSVEEELSGQVGWMNGLGQLSPAQVTQILLTRGTKQDIVVSRYHFTNH